MSTLIPAPIGRSVFALVAALASVVPLATAHAEDVALCVGVNHYPNLRPGANLNGCINDAHLFANKMGAFGIKNLKVLTDTTATKAGILGQLNSLKGKLHPGDRFVFYFAGHGTTSGQDEAVFLPSDARDDSEKNDMKVHDLYDAVKSLGAGVRKTIVLDSCHSGGMVPLDSRGWHPTGHKLRPRLYVRTAKLNQKAHGYRTVKRWQEVDNNGADDLSATVGAANTGATGVPASTGDGKDTVCYFTAAKQNEAANETEVGGEEHGLFTYYLVNSLKDKNEPWGKVESEVSGKVADATDNAQTPALHPNAELNNVAFGASSASLSPGADPTAPPPAAQTMTMKDVYCVSVPNPDVIALKRFPEQGPIAIGSKNYFEVSVKQDGFLVLIARDPLGNLDIMYPRTPAEMDAIAVHAGDTIRLPKEGRSFTPDTAGPDGVQAILFAHAEDAQAMLKPFLPSSPSGAGSPTRDASRSYRTRKARDAKHDWDEEPIPSANAAAATEATPAGTAPTTAPAATVPPFFTSEVTTLIVPRDEATP